MSAPQGYSVGTLKEFIGHDFGASEPIDVDQIRINTFADVTGDHQWIHVDVAKARKHSPFGGPVAHGFLTLSLMAAAVASAGVVPPDAKGVLNYGLEKVRFLAPVPSGATVRAHFKLADVEAKGDDRQLLRVEASVAIDGSDKPALVGELLAMVIG
ncbi:acyl dehydratase [Roseibium hamelinense]|uniref:Acyl dehydratase n=1 Tax=Roseibium hamelinense TaxID=150831 RepID=A0A562SHQ2_9HYPH|nr:MaoC family dehydratase [Roseibium hamelinense]MTI43873.1 MaoC family dehydratase [Roseibium hamelinense]TWI80835.1 acyl dehydratase [Roseibium hamelinense]